MPLASFCFLCVAFLFDLSLAKASDCRPKPPPDEYLMCEGRLGNSNFEYKIEFNDGRGNPFVKSSLVIWERELPSGPWCQRDTYRAIFSPATGVASGQENDPNPHSIAEFQKGERGSHNIKSFIARATEARAFNGKFQLFRHSQGSKYCSVYSGAKFKKREQLKPIPPSGTSDPAGWIEKEMSFKRNVFGSAIIPEDVQPQLQAIQAALESVRVGRCKEGLFSKRILIRVPYSNRQLQYGSVTYGSTNIELDPSSPATTRSKIMLVVEKQNGLVGTYDLGPILENRHHTQKEWEDFFVKRFSKLKGRSGNSLCQGAGVVPPAPGKLKRIPPGTVPPAPVQRPPGKAK